MSHTIRHLLFRSAHWSQTITRPLVQFFDALHTALVDDLKAFVDTAYDDMFPAYTRELTSWESAYDIENGDLMSLTETERRNRLSSLWSAQGGQTRAYIEATLQSAGFNVTVFESWIPDSLAPTLRVPFEGIGSNLWGCSDSEQDCGEDTAACGEYPFTFGYMLVNSLYDAQIVYSSECGEDTAACGEDTAACGEYSGVAYNRHQYAVPSEAQCFPYVLYICGSEFGSIVPVQPERRDEFEKLIKKIVPGHLWVALFVQYIDYTGIVLDNPIDDNLLLGNEDYGLLV